MHQRFLAISEFWVFALSHGQDGGEFDQSLEHVLLSSSLEKLILG